MPTQINICQTSAGVDEFIRRCACVLNTTIFAIVQDVMEMLLSEGHIPSVHQLYPSSGKLSSPYSRLASVNLIAHSINASAIILENIDRRMPLDQLSVLACVSHDIGKIPRLLKMVDGAYSRVKHARASANALQDLIGGRIPPRQSELIIDAVRHHHEYRNFGPIWENLVKADQLAREKEEFLLMSTRRQ